MSAQGIAPACPGISLGCVRGIRYAIALIPRNPRSTELRRGLAADLEDGFEARLGEWDVTTDQMTCGFSSANVAVRDGALVVTGEIAA